MATRHDRHAGCRASQHNMRETIAELIKENSRLARLVGILELELNDRRNGAQPKPLEQLRNASGKQILTDKQKEVLEVVRTFIARHSYPPTSHEVATALGFAADNGAHQHLKALATKGWIRRAPRIARGIEVLP